MQKKFFTLFLVLIMTNYSMDNPNHNLSQLTEKTERTATLEDISKGAMQIGAASAGTGLLTGIGVTAFQSGMGPTTYAGFTVGQKIVYLTLAGAPIPLMAGGILLTVGGAIIYVSYKGYKVIKAKKQQ